MTLNVTSLASKLELIGEVSARYMHESINQSETGLEPVIPFPFRREIVAVHQVLGRVGFLGGFFCLFVFGFVLCLFLVGLLLWFFLVFFCFFLKCFS